MIPSHKIPKFRSRYKPLKKDISLKKEFPAIEMKMEGRGV